LGKVPVVYAITALGTVHVVKWRTDLGSNKWCIGSN
jgi:hypothetical protein